MKTIFGSITDVSADAIVNAANTTLFHGGGVAAAIVEKGGIEIQKESEKIGWCNIGDAVVTGAGNLKAKYVIHVPTIDYENKKKATIEDVKNGFDKALKLAENLKCKSMAVPLLGAGATGLNRHEIKKGIEKISKQHSAIEVILVIRK